MFLIAADGPGDRFIIGESQAGEQVRDNSQRLHKQYERGQTNRVLLILLSVCITSYNYNY